MQTRAGYRASWRKQASMRQWELTTRKFCAQRRNDFRNARALTYSRHQPLGHIPFYEHVKLDFDSLLLIYLFLSLEGIIIQ